MKLTELFDRPVPFQIETSSDHHYEASFMIGEYRYIYDAHIGEEGKRIDPDDILDANIEFAKYEPGIGRVYSLTNDHNSAVILATVVNITRDLLSKYPISDLVFTAKEPKRKALYLRMVKKLIPTWTITEHGSEIIIVSKPYA